MKGRGLYSSARVSWGLEKMKIESKLNEEQENDKRIPLIHYGFTPTASPHTFHRRELKRTSHSSINNLSKEALQSL